MSYTIVVDEQYRSFERENTFNAIIRHCKIGKVTRHWLPKAVRFPAMKPEGRPSRAELLRILAGTGE